MEGHDPAEGSENADDRQSEQDPGDPAQPDDQAEMEKAHLEIVELHLKIIAAGLAVLLTLYELGSAIISNFGS
jgi:hypothetical protein